MGLGWNESDNLAEKHEDTGGIFVRLKNDGDSIVGAFVGEPYSREVHWTGEKYAKCTGPGCPHCEDKKPSFRACLNFYVPEEKAMKIIEGGAGWYRDLIKVRKKYGLDTWLFEIERHGEAKSPKTTYSILPETKISEALQEEIAQVKKHDLFAVAEQTKKADSEGSSSSSSTTPATIDAGVARAYIDRLKVLPRDAVDSFLSKFQIEKIKDVPRDAVSQATAFIEMLEGKYSPPKTTASEEIVDPFA